MTRLRWFTIFLTCLLLTLYVVPAHAGSITVTDLTYDLDGSPGNGSCSLREAIQNANDDAATNPDCGAGSGADVITLGVSGTISTVTHPQGGFSVTSDITINEGAGDVSISTDPVDNGQLFTASTSAAHLTLNGLRLVNGRSPGIGGCVVVTTGAAFTFNNGTLSDCTANSLGGAILGGIDTTITITNSTLDGNFGSTGGGAITMTGTGMTLLVFNLR